MSLVIQNLHAHYGKSHILRGVEFSVAPGEIVSLIGRNGSGRSTTLKTIMGLVTPGQGSVMLDGVDVARRQPYEIARKGIAYVPEERLVFANLTVEQNLQLGLAPQRSNAPAWSIAEMCDYFPRLAERRKTQAGSLSGGEQQMLTICRSLLGNPRFIMIDEPTEGLAPKIVDSVMQMIVDIGKRGVGVVLVEQKLTFALRISKRILVMGHGHIVFEGSPADLKNDAEIRRNWLEVA